MMRTTMNTIALHALTALCILTLGTITATAQRGGWAATFTYATAAPTGHLGDYTPGYSWAGAGAEIGYTLDDYNEVGINSGFQSFSELFRNELYTLKNGSAIYGTQVRYVTAVPLIAQATHTFGERGDGIRVYAGLGAGMYFMTQHLDLGMYTYSNSNTHFGLMPILGLKFRIDRKTSFVVQFDYNAALDAGETIAGYDDNSYSYFGIKTGFTFSD
jgi:hypothetical protein